MCTRLLVQIRHLSTRVPKMLLCLSAITYKRTANMLQHKREKKKKGMQK